MNRLVLLALVGPLLLPAVSGSAAAATQPAVHPGACKPSPTVLKASAAPVPGLSALQVQNATAIINAAAKQHVPERGQTIAVMTALEASALGDPAARQAQSTGVPGLFGPDPDHPSAHSSPTSPHRPRTSTGP